MFSVPDLTDILGPCLVFTDDPTLFTVLFSVEILPCCRKFRERKLKFRVELHECTALINSL